MTASVLRALDARVPTVQQEFDEALQRLTPIFIARTQGISALWNAFGQLVEGNVTSAAWPAQKKR
jgi:hypothetical protein